METNVPRYQWHAKDADGEPYSGDMVYDAAGPAKNRSGKAPRAPPPYGNTDVEDELEQEDEAAIECDKEESNDDETMEVDGESDV
ncbi:hypothetical protein H2200_003444 [Cladophialophora chaetospira]|uniref:Uncharacterized protein n=1 Tax=Cladophialophora chaetospira TaxID=386627 RepID=A0AA38XHG2_9EURO|nr:hypothetical protein H2200_003444 [Cladophialophora chaetospira]